MRILHVITTLETGGAEKLMVDLLPLLNDNGHEVELLLFDGHDTDFQRQLEAQGVTIHRLSQGGSVYSPAHIWRLIRFIGSYDLVHTHNTACQYYVSIASRFSRRNLRLVTTEHNTTNRRRSRFIFRLIDRWIYKAYDEIVAISPAAASSLAAHLGNSRKINVIQNGICLSAFKPEPRIVPGPTDTVEITMVGAFRPQKNQDDLIRAMSLLPKRYRLTLVGDGARHDEIAALVESMHLSERVELAGIRRDVAEIMRRSDVVVLSSHWEGFGLAAVEGMASHRPVIASDVAGLREVVDGAGVLVRPEDPRDMADKILALTSDASTYTAVADACLQRAAMYDIKATAKGYMKLYEKLSFGN